MKNKIITIIIILIILILDIVFIFQKDIQFSESENRFLTQIPKFEISKILDGKYMDKITEYLKDQFPYREKFVGLKTTTQKLTLKEEINDIYLGKDNYLIKNYHSIEDKDKLVRIFNGLNDNININLKLLLVPTSISINEDELPALAIYDKQIDDIRYIANDLNFKMIDAFDKLKWCNKSENVFYQTDHHWTTYGAYCTYQEISKYYGFNYIQQSSFNIREVSNNFYGTHYSKTNDYSRLPDKIYIYEYNNNLDVYYSDKEIHTNSLYNYSYLDKKDKYAMFLDNNHSLIVITNKDIDSEKELIVIKDSYANSLIPFLVNHYKRIHVIDPRYYNQKISDYINSHTNIIDGLIIYNMDTIEDDLGVYTIR